MKSFLRSAVVAASVVVATTVGTSPASATPGLLQFQGTAHIGCFGCVGTPTGTASLIFTGVLGATPLVAVPANATFTAMYPTVVDRSVDCLLAAAARGVVTGPGLSLDFSWTRLGAIAVITTTGDVVAVGTAVFQVTDPVGLPCRNGVTATVVGAIGGV